MLIQTQTRQSVTIDRGRIHFYNKILFVFEIKITIQVYAFTNNNGSNIVPMHLNTHISQTSRQTVSTDRMQFFKYP
jgi:hypothetical protein